MSESMYDDEVDFGFDDDESAMCGEASQCSGKRSCVDTRGCPFSSSLNENQEAISRLEEIQQEINELAAEALELLRCDYPHLYAQGRAYWYPHILGATNKEESGYLGGSMIDMQSAIKELRNEEPGEVW